VLDGDEYVINGEKISSPPGSRATTSWCGRRWTSHSGRAAIKSFIVPREHPGVTVERLEDKLGIKASDTAVIRFRQRPDPQGQPAR
jgi:alkylation response protein AidB-like acyl-CoA dehydrogenase